MVEAAVAIHGSPNAKTAAREVAKSAMGRIRGDADLAIVFLSDRYHTNTEYQEALHAIQTQIGEQTPIVGCISPVVFASGELPTIRGAALMLLRSQDITFVPLAFQQAKRNASDIAKEMVKSYLPAIEASTAHTVFMFASGPIYPADAYSALEVTNSWVSQNLTLIMSTIIGFVNKRLAKQGQGRPTDYIDSLLEKLAREGITNVVGGNSLSHNVLYGYEFFNTNVLNNSVVSCLLTSNKLNFGTGWSYGATPTGKKISIDKSLGGGLVLRANKKGGHDALLETTGIPKEYVVENLAGEGYALLYHLLGVKNKTAHKYLPYVSTVPPNLDAFVSALPDQILKSGEEVELLIQSGDDILSSVGPCLRDATANIRQPEFAIIFECSNRAYALGDKILQEDAIIKETLGAEIPYIGFGGGGEFCYKAEGHHFVCSTIHALVAGK